MALDGITLSFLIREINRGLESSRVDKILQPEKDEINFVFRQRGSNPRLLLSASASNPRIHFTAIHKENPASPPMFCMLLRKHLSGAKFAGARQNGLDRVAFLDFDTRNEFGDEVRRTIAVEIMGRHSNIILTDENGRILDAVKRVDQTMSSVRQIFPGLPYELPPQQDKLNLAAVSADEIHSRLRAHKDGELSRALMDVLQGVSPIVCRELTGLACRGGRTKLGELTDEDFDRLRFYIGRLAQSVLSGTGRPVMAADVKSGKPLDFSCLEITQYGVGAVTRGFDTFSEMLDSFYSERDRVERVGQRARDILNVITNAAERVSRKLGNQQMELQECANRGQLKMSGDLISANLYRLEKGAEQCEVENFYDSANPMVVIRLDATLTPAQNAQKYYREYRKATIAETYLNEQICADREELAYLDTVFDELSRASGESELGEIREELESVGYLKARNRNGRKSRPSKADEPMKFRSTDGFAILAGKNNRQNDRLTLKTAEKRDIWLHTKNIPGSHVIVISNGETVSDQAVTEAAIIAASHSRAGESSQVPVDYTQVRNVKKPSGAKPGMVIYENYKTAFVKPDREIVDRLKV